MTCSFNRKAVRSSIRQQRRSLSPSTHRHNQIKVLQHLKRSRLLQQHNRFAIYLHADGELHTDLLIDYLLKQHKQVYLPVLYPLNQNRLWFVPYDTRNNMRRNRFNIQEPANIQQRLAARFIDVILMPLVGFDLNANRLGMGGGFYDRTLARQAVSSSQRPKCIGLAHELQKLDQIENQSWDKKLDAVITQDAFYNFAL